MKKKFILLFSVVFLAGFSFCQPSISKFSLKLSGGIGYFSVGELNSVMAGDNDYLYALFGNVSGGYKNMHLGVNLSLEAMYFITDRIGIGLGGGFFQVNKEDKIHWENGNNTIRNDATYSRTIGFVPLTLNIHYIYPLGSKLNLSLSGGVGYYLTSFEFNWAGVVAWPTFTSHATATNDFKTKGTIGFQASLGLEMPLTKNLGLFVAAKGWYSSISGLSGDTNGEYVENNISGSYKYSNVHFWVYNYLFHAKTYPHYEISTNGPYLGESNSNIHELKIDLSGFSLGVGLRINF